MDAVEPLKGWSLELAGQEYGAGFLSSIPWPTLRALAQDKVKLLRLQQQQVAQKSPVGTRSSSADPKQSLKIMSLILKKSNACGRSSRCDVASG